MTAILELLWEAAVQSSVLFAATWALRWLLKGRVSPRLQYALWGLMLLRLLLPLGIESPMSVMNAVEPATAAVRQFAAPQLPAGPVLPPQGMPAAAADAAPGWAHLLVGLWIAGMTAVAVWMAVTNLRFRSLALRGAKPLQLTREYARALRRCGVKRAIPLYVTDGVPSPCLIGVMRPMVLLTPESAALPGRLHHILLHELCHWRQRDNWIALLRNLACMIHWYNPLVWIAARMSRQDCELACDARVLQLLAHGESLVYGETLVRLIRSRAAAGPLQTATTMAAGKQEMKERLNMIVRQPRTAVLAAAAALLVSVALAAAACTGAVREQAPGSSADPTGSPAQSATPTNEPPASARPNTATSSPLPTAAEGGTVVEPASDKAVKLWEQDGWTYWLESRAGEDIETKDGKSNPLGNRIGRLYRTQDQMRETLEEFVKLDENGSSWCVLPVGDRVVCTGYSGETFVELKGSGSIVSIRPDGSDRKVYTPKFNTAANLCYDGGYLYYGGWTNDGAFPRPINRLNTDLTNDYKMADIDGAFITARGGYAYFVHRKGDGIYRIRLDWKSSPEHYADCEMGTAFTVTQAGENELILTDRKEVKETYRLTLP